MSGKLGGIFDQLEDLTPAEQNSLGQEIGDALTGALKDLDSKQDSRTAKAIEAMADSISKALPKQVPIATPKPVTGWEFDIERDDDGLMTRVVAKANQ